MNGHGVNSNINQDVNKLRQLPFQRGDAIAVGLNNVDSQNPDSNERALNVNDRNSESISVNESSIALSHTTRPKSLTPSVRKLRKKHPGRDEHGSVGGYTSDKSVKRKEKSRDDTDAKVKPKKSFIQVINKISNDVQSPSQGYESDGDTVLSSQKSKKVKKKSKTKNPSKETGYDTDGGYQSENRKSKTRFFRLSTKSSRSDFHAVANEPVPALPNSVEKKGESAVPLPIAGRFATAISPSMPPSPTTTTTEGTETHVDSSIPQIPFQPFPATFDVTSTTSSSSPVSAEQPSTFDRAPIAPTSDSPSAFKASLHPKKRDSRFSFGSSSSSSGSNQHNKLQNLKGLFPPLNAPSSSKQEHQQHRLRPSLSLSSLNHPKPVISFPITRDISPTSTNPPLPSTRSLHSLSVSPTSTSFRSSVSSFQIKKPFRIKLHHPDLPTQQEQQQNSPPSQTTPSSPSGPELAPQIFLAPSTLPVLQIPKVGKVRPRNPPIDGFGPRSPLTPDSTSLGSYLRPSPISSPIISPGSSSDNSGGGLSPNSHIQASSKRSSQQTIIPSSDYIVPSPRNSPLKTQYPEPPSPTAALMTTMTTTYHHHDLIPPQPSPAPRGPLPTPPSSNESGESPAAGDSSGGSSESAGQQQQLPPLAAGVQTRQIIGGSGVIEKTGGGVVGLRVEKKSGIGLNAADDNPTAKYYQKEKAKEARLSRFAAAVNNRKSWIDIDGDSSLETLEGEEDEEEPEDIYEILDRFEHRDSNENEDGHHPNSNEQALERSHSFKAGKHAKEKRYHYPEKNNNSFKTNARPPPPPLPRQYVPAAAVIPDLYGFEDDDGKSVGDRTSRWTESVYSRSSSSSILDEEESEERRGRFLKRVEAMLDAEKNMKAQAAQAQAYIPPLPKIPHAYANIVHTKNGNGDGNGNTNENAASHQSNITPGRSWNKF